MKTLTFDKNAPHWCKYYGVNEVFIDHQIDYIIEKLSYRGYIYLNEIYEAFGLNWDPHDENTVWINNERDIQFRYEAIEDNAFVIYVEDYIRQ